MFYEQDNASKFALMELLKILKENKCSFFDTQMVTPITERFGAKEISRAKFLSILQQEREKNYPTYFNKSSRIVRYFFARIFSKELAEQNFSRDHFRIFSLLILVVTP